MLDPALIVLATLVGSMVLFLTDALRYDVVAILVVAVLALTGCLTPEEAFAGFASPAVVLIASMYVFGHAFNRYGVAEAIGKRFLTGKEGGETMLAFKICLVAGLLSSVLSNTGVVATLVPVCASLAKRYRVSVSRLLMPMAFGSLCGGLVTLIATSTNVAIDQVVRSEEGVGLGMFEFTHLGLLLLGVTSLYMLGPGRLLLPRSPVDQSLSERYQVPKFVTEVLVEPASSLINRAVADADVFTRNNINVLGIVRGGGEGTVLAPGPYNRIRADDTLILQGAPDDILRLGSELPLKERKSVDAAGTRLYSDDVRLIEAVIPAGSLLVGHTLVGTEFRTRTGLNALALAKHGRVRLERVQDTMIEVGDTLLLQGHQRDFDRARNTREILVLDEVGRPHFGRGSRVSIAVLALVLLGAAVTPINLAVLAMCGALALILTRVVRAEEVSQCIDWPVIGLVGGMLALGTAFERHDLGKQVADGFLALSTQGFGAHVVLSALLVTTVLLTQVLNNVSTAIILTPVAFEVAAGLGLASRPFVMAVVVGSSLAFMSPVAHQANAMVSGPGGYRYKDFLRAGSLLAAILTLVSSIMIPILWPF